MWRPSSLLEAALAGLRCPYETFDRSRPGAILEPLAAGLTRAHVCRRWLVWNAAVWADGGGPSRSGRAVRGEVLAALRKAVSAEQAATLDGWMTLLAHAASGYLRQDICNLPTATAPWGCSGIITSLHHLNGGASPHNSGEMAIPASTASK